MADSPLHRMSAIDGGSRAHQKAAQVLLQPRGLAVQNTKSRARKLENFNRIGRHPNVELLELRLDLLFELQKESSVFGNIRHVDKNSH